MKIKPDDSWHWYFDAEYDRLMLDLSNGMLFRSHFLPKMLISDAFEAAPFSVEDASLYYAYHDQCRCLTLTKEQQIELTLNALVAFRFMKPQMPKSWHFIQQNQAIQPKNGDIVVATLLASGQLAQLLVVEAGDNASLCLLAQPGVILSGRRMQLGDAIKVMHDRLCHVAITDNREAIQSYARAV